MVLGLRASKKPTLRHLESRYSATSTRSMRICNSKDYYRGTIQVGSVSSREEDRFGEDEE